LSTKLFSYGFKGNCDYRICRVKFTELKYYFEIQNNGHVLAKPVFDGVARLLLYSFCAAIAVADLLELPVHEVGEAIKEFKPVSGRMQVLSGIKQSIIIDDTYNASPNATLAALDVLYGLEASHRIAVLGNMNELGKYSRHSHLEVGGHCDPKKLELLITIGPDANRYLATAAKQEGCRVKSFNDPIAAGEYLKSVLRKDTAVLFKGSQNRVYAEEAIKPILANQADSSRLVRQSTAWMAKKTASFRYNS
jgi:UDP-N-acetylmuramoyl-tripeptide--D-alanyl-D-alanine ligase